MGTFVTPADLTPFATIDLAKATAMIEDAEAMAILTAPCLSTTEVASATWYAARAILRGAILRWNEAGTGVIQQTQVGPFGQSMDTRTVRKAMFWPSEITQLQSLCSTTDGKAFAVDTFGADTIHAPWCALAFGATYCSCGADIAGYPIFEAP
jgi:hypothetical protein